MSADLPAKSDGPTTRKPDPAHVLISGQTMSGKSTIARVIMSGYLDAGIMVAVYSPVEPVSKWDARAFVTASFYEFEMYIRSKMPSGGLLVIDEADTVLSMSHKCNWHYVTRMRHFGFRVLVITPRPKIIAPTVRDACAECYLFNISASDAKMIADDHNAPDMINATKAKQGEYVHVGWHEGFKRVDYGRVF